MEKTDTKTGVEKEKRDKRWKKSAQWGPKGQTPGWEGWVRKNGKTTPTTSLPKETSKKNIVQPKGEWGGNQRGWDESKGREGTRTNLWGENSGGTHSEQKVGGEKVVHAHCTHGKVPAKQSQHKTQKMFFSDRGKRGKTVGRQT